MGILIVFQFIRHIAKYAYNRGLTLLLTTTPTNVSLVYILIDAYLSFTSLLHFPITRRIWWRWYWLYWSRRYGLHGSFKFDHHFLEAFLPLFKHGFHVLHSSDDFCDTSLWNPKQSYKQILISKMDICLWVSIFTHPVVEITKFFGGTSTIGT